MLKLTIQFSIVMALLIAISPTLSRAADPGEKAPTSAPTTNPTDGPAKFYGTITAIDAAAKSFTVDGQTYYIVGESQVTLANEDNKTATIDDAKVGEPARGTYTKSADGKMNVTKVRFGKKTGGKNGGGGKKKSESSTTQPNH